MIRAAKIVNFAEKTSPPSDYICGSSNFVIDADCDYLCSEKTFCAMFKAMLVAGLGGFVGTCLRFLTGKLCQTLCVSAFPWGTFTVNIVGSFIIGLLFGLVEKTSLVSPTMSVLLITGFCGGFTTFSSMSGDMLVLLQQRHWLLFGAYVVGSLALGLLMVWAGRAVIKG